MDDLIIYVTHMVDHEGHYREYIGHKKTPQIIDFRAFLCAARSGIEPLILP